MLIILLAIVIWLAGLFYAFMTAAYLLGFICGEEQANKVINKVLDWIFFWVRREGLDEEG